jgi:GDP-L-fucose synthase
MSLDESSFSRFLKEDVPPLVNIGCGKDLTIRELVTLVRDVVGFKGVIEWDSTKPDGTPRKLLDVSRLFAQGWHPQTELSEGVKKAYDDFLKLHVV